MGSVLVRVPLGPVAWVRGGWRMSVSGLGSDAMIGPLTEQELAAIERRAPTAYDRVSLNALREDVLRLAVAARQALGGPLGLPFDELGPQYTTTMYARLL